MTEVEYYAKAQRDDSFRQEQLEEWAYIKNLNRMGFVLSGLVLAVYIGYCGFIQHRCPDLSAAFIFLLLASWGYTRANTKVVALKSINQSSDGLEPVRLKS